MSDKKLNFWVGIGTAAIFLLMLLMATLFFDGCGESFKKIIRF